MIAPRTSIAARQRRVTFQIPAPPIPDGEGGYLEQWTTLEPSALVQIAPASVHALERLAAGTVFSTATHLVTAPYRAGVTTNAQLVTDDGRKLRVLGVQDNNERRVELLLFCTEIL